MGKDNTSNFATSTLNGSILSTDMSFAVQTGQGSLFPTVNSTHPSYFKVTIGSEVIICSARSSDTFTVSQRGAEGTTAAGHSNGAAVTHAQTSGMVDHLWQNVADTFNANVPLYARNGTAPGTYDDEFETQAGAWTVPSTSGGDLIDFNVVPSCLRFQRADFSTNAYSVYKSFPLGTSTSFEAICRMSHGARVWESATQTPPAVELTFFVSDQAAPTSTNTGNVVRLDHVLSGEQFTITDVYGRLNGTPNSTFVTRTEVVKAVNVISSVYHALTFSLFNGYQYYKISYTGSGVYQLWTGDGLTWKEVAYIATTINVQSIGFSFFTNTTASAVQTQQHAVIYFLRVNVGGAYAYY